MPYKAIFVSACFLLQWSMVRLTRIFHRIVFFRRFPASPKVLSNLSSAIYPGFQSCTAGNEHKPPYHKAFQGGCMFLFRNPGRRRKHFTLGCYESVFQTAKNAVTSESGFIAPSCHSPLIPALKAVFHICRRNHRLTL